MAVTEYVGIEEGSTVSATTSDEFVEIIDYIHTLAVQVDDNEGSPESVAVVNILSEALEQIQKVFPSIDLF